jgi:hypothetical protein
MSNTLRGLEIGVFLLCAACVDSVAPAQWPLRLDASVSQVPLPIGEYVAYARLEHESYALQSAKVAIDVR